MNFSDTQAIHRKYPPNSVAPLAKTASRSSQFRTALVRCFGLLIAATELLAQEKVVLQLEGQSSRTVLPCQIVDYNGEKITLQLKSGAPQKTYPAEQVVEVQTDWLEGHERGRKLLAARQVDDAIPSLQEALVRETRAWVRREIVALLIRCSLRQGDRATAAERFLKLLENDPKSRHFALIPLVWASEPANSAAKSSARAWLTQEVEVAKLLGASLLLDDGQLGETAQRELTVLQRGRDERLRLLAQAQTWRLKLRTLDISEWELQRWESRVRELPSSLRAGPSYLVGRGWAMRREHERAATALLWLPLMDDADPRLAARAGFEAAESLRRLGQKDDAHRVLQEIAARFPDTEFGEAAAK